jgi:hypothetical protein
MQAGELWLLGFRFLSAACSLAIQVLVQSLSYLNPIA